MLFVLMFLGLIVSTSIPEAYGDKGVYFAFAYFGIQVGRSIVTAFPLKSCGHQNFRDFVRIAIWMSASGGFWIAGAFMEAEARLIAWIIAIAIEYAAAIDGFWTPGLGRSTAAGWKVNGAHMAERCALFIIIGIGETILVSGRVFSETAVTPASAAAFGVGFLKTLALWWIYFRFGRARTAEVMSQSDQTGALARLAYTYAHIPIVVGIIVSAVGTEFLLAHPYDPAGWREISALTAGPAIYLFGTLVFKRAVMGRWPLSHGAGIVLLAAIAIAGQALTPILIGAMSVIALIITAGMEWAAERRLSRAAQAD
jgi:low temperature requirement protein LtrA